MQLPYAAQVEAGNDEASALCFTYRGNATGLNIRLQTRQLASNGFILEFDSVDAD